MNTKKDWISQHELLIFILGAYALSWLVEFPLALQYRGVVPWDLPFALHYLASFGPLLSAVLVTGISRGKPGLRALWQDMTRWRIKWVWWLAALSPLVMYLLAALIQAILGMPVTSLAELGQVDFLPALGLLVLPLWILTFGIGEETGWRGFALPRLQQGRSALLATVMLWGVWAFWHLPLFFYSYSLYILPGFAIGLLAGSIIFTWLYNSTGGSVLLTACWHGLFNVTTACIPCKTGFTAAFISTLVMIGAVVVVLVYKPAKLSRCEKRLVEGGIKSF
ncbi:MAG: CPBP family intramembrane metalloprotease [Anaerolineales bacterium]